ncbi:MAG: M23 family metallopeptidase [Alphaproteobacteria bacterium]|nr:M23 family metallopeptidase [Alphaproteobacteria bacterium]
MKMISVVILSALVLTACDLRQVITGKETLNEPATAPSGGFWGRTDAEAATKAAPAENIQTANAADYVAPVQAAQPARTAISTAVMSDYFVTVDAADYVPPAPPKPVAQEDQGDDDAIMVPARAATVASVQEVQTVKQPDNLITVAVGDTLYSLSRKHNVPLRDLITANKLEPPYPLRPGQTLFMPNQFVHTVARGETLYSISRMYQMDLNSLASMNNIKAPFALAVGQRLVLPAQIQLTAAAAATPPAESTAQTPVPATTVTAAAPTAEPVAATPIVRRPAAPVRSLPQAPARAGNKFAWPLRGTVISKFGAKSNGLYNDGINIRATRGAPVSAAENGVVAYAGNEIRGWGNMVIIKHADNWMTVYAHLDTILVERGKTVARGAKIGSAGMTGRVNTPQLHFGIRRGTRAFDPMRHLQ